jgi:hypothetical protein
MARCANCGADNPENVVFCGHCAARMAAAGGGSSVDAALFEAPGAAAAGPVICPACGREAQPHYKFCLGCGEELPPPGAMPQGPPVLYPPGMGAPPPQLQVRTTGPGAPQGGPRRAPVLLAAIAFAIMAAAGAFFFLQSSREPSSSATSTSAPATAVPPAPAVPQVPLPAEAPAAFPGVKAPAAVELPPAVVTATDDTRTTIADTLRETVGGPVRKCWEEALAAGTATDGRLTVQLVIATDGSVTATNGGGEAALVGTTLETCVLSAFAAVSFAGKLALTEPLTVSYPVILQRE